MTADVAGHDAAHGHVADQRARAARAGLAEAAEEDAVAHHPRRERRGVWAQGGRGAHLCSATLAAGADVARHRAPTRGASCLAAFITSIALA